MRVTKCYILFMLLAAAVSAAGTISANGLTVSSRDWITGGALPSVGFTTDTYRGTGNDVFVEIDSALNADQQVSISLRSARGTEFNVTDIQQLVQLSRPTFMGTKTCTSVAAKLANDSSTLSCTTTYKPGTEKYYVWQSVNTFIQQPQNIFDAAALLIDGSPKTRKYSDLGSGAKEWQSNTVTIPAKGSAYFRLPYMANRYKDVKFDVVVAGSGYETVLDPFFNSSMLNERQVDVNFTGNGTQYGVPVPINGSAGFTVNGSAAQHSWTLALAVNGTFYCEYNGQYDFQCANSTLTARLPLETENAAGANYSATGVWDANHTGVYHMALSGGNIKDSTSNGRTLAMTGGTLNTTALLGLGTLFDGASSGVISSLPLAPSGTWILIASRQSWALPASEQALFGRGVDCAAGNDFYVSDHGAIGIQWCFLSHVNSFNAAGAPANSQHFIAGTWLRNGSLTMLTLFWDGVVVSQSSTADSINTVAAMNVGANARGITQYLDKTSIDEIRFMNRALTAGEILAINQTLSSSAFTFGAQLTNDNAPNLTIVSPANQTTLNTTALLNFTVTDDHALTLPCWKNVDGAGTVSVGTITSGAYYSEVLNLSHGTHSVAITCQDNFPQNTTKTVYFTTLHMNVTAQSYVAQQYETNMSNFTMTVSVAPAVSSVAASLKYNGTENLYDFSSSSAGVYTFARMIPILLAEQNNTNRPFNWSIQLTYANASTSNFTGNTSTQNVQWGYLIQGLSFPASVLATSAFGLNTTARKFVTNANLSNEVVVFSATTPGVILTTNSTHDVYAVSLTSPSTGITYALNSTLIINFLGSSRNITNSSTISVVPISLDDCSVGTTPIYNFTFADENTGLGGLANFVGVFKLWAVPGAEVTSVVNVSNRTYVNICTLGGNFIVNASIIYGNATYPQREFYLDNNHTAAAVQNVTLYGLDQNQVTVAQVTIADQANVRQPNIIVIAQRYYPTPSPAWATVAMAKTDTEGLASLKLIAYNTQLPAVFYRFILESNGNIYQITAGGKLISDPATGIIYRNLNLFAPVSQFFNIFNKASVSCANTSNTVSCSYVDLSNQFTYANLTLSKLTGNSTTVLCLNTSTVSADTLSCSLGSVINGTYTYSLVAGYASGDAVVLAANSLIFLPVNIFGATGALIASILILILTGMGAVKGPSGAIAGGLFGIFISSWLTFIVVPVTVLGGLFVAALAVAYVVERRA